jgi:hypothetical protein
MTRVALRIDDFEDGTVPQVCASSGRQADRLYGVKARYIPRWPLVFLLLGPVGLIITLVVSTGVDREVGGYLPLSDEAYRRSVAARRTWAGRAVGAVAATFAVGLALANVSHAASAPLLAAIVGGVVVAGCSVRAARPPGSVGASLGRNGRSVELSGASTRFAEAYADQEARRRAARQAVISCSSQPLSGHPVGDVAADR